MARRRHTPELITNGLAEAGAVWSGDSWWSGSVGRAGVTEHTCWRRRKGAPHGIQATRNRQPRRVGWRGRGGGCGGCLTGSPGKATGGDLLSLTPQAESVTQTVAGCWRSWWCGACRVLGQPWPRPALPCSFAGQLGRRFGGRELWGWPHGLGQVTATGGSAALPLGLGAGRPAASGRGRRPAPAGGAPGCRAGNPRTGPAAPQLPQSRLGHPVRLAARTHQRAALAAASAIRPISTIVSSLRGSPAKPISKRDSFSPRSVRSASRRGCSARQQALSGSASVACASSDHP